MFFKPIKFDQIVVSPPVETRKKGELIFSRILENYNKNYEKFRVNPQENVLKDPWFKRESWRWDPFFSKRNIFRNSFPGLKIAVAAFSIYLVYDFITEKGGQKGHGGHD